MRRNDAVSAAFGSAVLIVAVLVIGAALRWTQALVALLLIPATLPLLRSRRRFASISPLVVALAIPLALTVIQLLPIPGLGGALDPVNHKLRDEGLALAGAEPMWDSITLDIPGSLRSATYFVILLAVAVLALRMATSERGRYRILAAVTFVCGLVVVVVAVHKLLGATALYGVYEPVQATPPVLGPLLNANHLGCLMAMGCVLGISLAAYGRQPGWLRSVWACTAVGCAIVTFATLSRGATLALGAGALATITMLVAPRFGSEVRRHRRRFLTSSLPIAIVAACALVIVVYTSAGDVGRQIQDTSLAELNADKSKYAAWRSSSTLVGEAPWLGVGRGAFEPAFTRVHAPSAFQTASHLENEYLQAIVDFGIPGALLCGFAVIWFAVVALKKWRDGPLAAGALGAMGVVALQSVVDFGIELLGVGIPVVAIAATVSYGPLQESSGLSLLRARAARGLHCAVLGLAAFLLFQDCTRSVDEDHQEVLASDPITLAELAGPIRRHPLDYYNYGVAASVKLRDREDGAIQMLNHALVLHPTHSGLHRMTARVLRSYDLEAQAAIEYAAALRGTSTPRALLQEILLAFKDDPGKAATAIPLDLDPDIVARTLVQLEAYEVATVWLARYLRAHPKNTHSCELLVAITINQGKLTAAEIAARHCVEIVSSKQTRLALARVLYANGAYNETIAQLKDVMTWSGRIAETLSAWLMLCDAHAELRHWDDAVSCLRKLDASGLIVEARRAEVTNRVERVEKRRRAFEIIEPELLRWLMGV